MASCVIKKAAFCLIFWRWNIPEVPEMGKTLAISLSFFGVKNWEKYPPKGHGGIGKRKEQGVSEGRWHCRL